MWQFCIFSYSSNAAADTTTPIATSPTYPSTNKAAAPATNAEVGAPGLNNKQITAYGSASAPSPSYLPDEISEAPGPSPSYK